MTEPTLFLENPLGSDVVMEDILDAFEFIDDWEERYAYIIELGKKLPAFPESEKVEANKVHGCQSQVWLIHYHRTEDDRHYFLLDSDALIVRGLAALILCMLNKKTAAEIREVNVDSLFTRLDLFRHISPTRGNGLRAMLQKMLGVALATTAVQRPPL